MNQNPAETIARFCSVARPVILRFFPANSCIASSRIAIEVLNRFGIEAEAVPVSAIVQVKARNLAFLSGFDTSRLPEGAVPMHGDSGNLWRGHVVVIGGGFLIDPSFDQFSMPGYGVEIPPHILAVPVGDDIVPANMHASMVLVTDAGETLDVTYSPLGDNSFLDAPAWETDHLELAIEIICRKMTEAMEAEHAPLD